MISDFERHLGDIERRARNGEVILTKFLDLSEQSLALKLAKEFKINFFGGIEGAERKRALVNIKNPKISEYNIIAYQIIFSKMVEFNHRNVLGTIMSLGVKRNTFGDIIVSNQEIYLLVSTEIAEYLETEFTEINHQPITLKKVNYQKLEIATTKAADLKTIIVPSFRLDVIIAYGFGISRNNVVKHIESGLVFINNKQILKPDYEVHLDEIISVRKYGRIKLVEIGKVTKKERIVIKIQVYK